MAVKKPSYDTGPSTGKQSPFLVRRQVKNNYTLGWLGKAVLLVCLLAEILTPGLSRLGMPFHAHAFSVGEEQQVGEKLLSLVRRSFNIVEEPDLIQYITGLAGKILTVTDSHYFKYHFFLINKNEFNAFAAPSGLIFLYSGLIESVDTEDELISVLAHETAHVAHRHIAQQAEKSTVVNIATMMLILAGIAGIAMGGGDLGTGLIYGGMAAGATAQLKYTRQDEEEADRLAYDWMRAMNRDPSAMVGMLRKMHRVSVLSMNQLPTYLLTHPEPSQRMGYIEDLLASNPKKIYPSVPTFSFQRMKYRLLSITSNPIKLLERLQGSSTEKGDAMLLYGLSQAYLVNAEFSKAEKTLRQVMAIYPKQHILQTDLGRIFFEAGRYDEALAVFKKAREKLPACAYTAFYLARTLQQKNSLPSALKLYEDILATLPTFSRLHYQIGQIMANQGQTAGGHYHLGLYYWFEGDSKLANFHLKKAIKNTDKNDDINKKSTEMLAKIAKLEKL